MTFREYQQEIYNLVYKALQRGEKKILIQLAGGAGKTFLFTKILEDFTREFNKQAIFLTPRINLSKQTHREEYGYYQGNTSKNLDSDVIIGNIQTFAKRPLNFIDVILFDECHMIDNTAKAIIEKLGDDKIYIAISATPYKSNGSKLEAFADFTHLNHQYDENYLIANGYLAPMRYYKTENIEEYEDILEVSSSSGDFTDESLRALERKGVFDDIWGSIKDKVTKDEIKEQGLLVITHSQEQAKKIADEFTQNGFRTGLIISNNKEGDKDLSLFSEKKLDVAVAVDKVSTGTDIKHLGNIVLARAFNSHSLFRQAVYRADRICDGKEFFRVFDLGNNWDRLGNPFIHPDPKDNEESNSLKKKKCECGSDEFTIERFNDYQEGVRVTIKECSVCRLQTIFTKKIDGIECDRCSLIMPLSLTEVTKTHTVFKCHCGNTKSIKRSPKKLEIVKKNRDECKRFYEMNIEKSIELDAFFSLSSLQNINFFVNLMLEGISKEKKEKLINRAKIEGSRIRARVTDFFIAYASRNGVEEKIITLVDKLSDEMALMFANRFIQLNKTPRRINKLIREFEEFL